MADRITTLRVKTAGLDDASNDLDAFARKRSALLAGMANAEKAVAKAAAEANQAMLDRDFGKEAEAIVKGNRALERRVELNEKLARTAERAGVDDPLKAIQLRRDDVTRQYNRRMSELSKEVPNASDQSSMGDEKSIEKAKERAQARLAFERSYASEMRELWLREYQLKSAAEGKALDNNMKALGMDFKARQAAAAKAMKLDEKVALSKQKLFDKELLDLQKTFEAENKLYERFYSENLKVAERAEADRLAIAERGVDAAQRYLDKNLAERGVTSGGGSGGNGLSGFGGKMILGMAAGRSAGDIIGDQHGGREIGSAVSAFLFAPEIAPAIIAMETIGTVAKANRDDFEEVAKATQEYTASLREMSNEWSKLGTDLVKRDTFEESMRRVAETSREKAARAQEEISKAISEGESFGDTLNGAINPWAGDSVLMTKYKAGRKTIDRENANADAAEAFERSEHPKRVADQEKIFDLERRLTNTRKVGAGYIHDQAVVMAEMAVDQAKMDASHREALAQSDASLSQSYKLMKESKDNLVGSSSSKNSADYGILADAAVEATRKYEKDLNDRKELESQQMLDLKHLRLHYEDEVDSVIMRHIEEQGKASVKWVEEHVSRVGKFFDGINRQQSESAKRFTEEGWKLQEEVAKLAELAASPAADQRHIDEEFDARDKGRSMGKDEAKALARDKALLAESEQHLKSVREVEREESEARYIVEERRAKTKADRDKAKHDYEVREGIAAGRSREDAEKSADARDALDELKADKKSEIGLASDRYQGVVGSGQTGDRFIDFSATNTNSSAGKKSGRQMTSGQLDAYRKRWGSKAALPSGFVEDVQSGGLSTQQNKTPGEVALEKILKVLEDIRMQKIS